MGRIIGILYCWAQCEASVKGLSGARYESFKSRADALAYLASQGVLAPQQQQQQEQQQWRQQQQQ